MESVKNPPGQEVVTIICVLQTRKLRGSRPVSVSGSRHLCGFGVKLERGLAHVRC